MSVPPSSQPPGIYCAKCRKFVAETLAVKHVGKMFTWVFFEREDPQIESCPFCGSEEFDTICELVVE